MSDKENLSKIFCSNCGFETVSCANFCSNCGNKLSAISNSIESGDSSINTIGSDITNSAIHIGNNYNNSNNIDPTTLNIKRHFINLPWIQKGKIAKQSVMLKLGTWGSIASILGLFLPFENRAYISFLFMVVFVPSIIFFGISLFLKKFRFMYLFGLNNLEAGTKDGIYLTKITCDCPWCGTEMKLMMIGPRGNREHVLLCERNPRQHRIEFDATVLSDIEE